MCRNLDRGNGQDQYNDPHTSLTFSDVNDPLCGLFALTAVRTICRAELFAARPQKTQAAILHHGGSIDRSHEFKATFTRNETALICSAK